MLPSVVFLLTKASIFSITSTHHAGFTGTKLTARLQLILVDILHPLNTSEAACSPKAGEPHCNLLWANKAAVARFGRALTHEERNMLLSQYPPPALEVCIAVMTKLHNNVVVRCYLSKPKIKLCGFQAQQIMHHLCQCKVHDVLCMGRFP